MDMKKLILITSITSAIVVALIIGFVISMSMNFNKPNGNIVTTVSSQSTTNKQAHTCEESDWVIDLEPTKSENGLKHTECIVCEKKMNEEIISATGSIGLKYTLTYDGQGYSVSNGSCDDEDVVILKEYKGKPVTTIDDAAFSRCNWITSITIPDSVTDIYQYAFSGCTVLTSINIPDSVEWIGEYAFQDCYLLTNIEIPSSVTRISKCTFIGCSSLANVVIPDGVEFIGWGAFYSCESLENILIPANVTTIESYAFHLCNSLANIEVDTNNKYYKSIAGNLYSKDGKTLMQYASGKIDASFTIPNNVTTIAEGSVSRAPYLTSVTIPKSVTYIGESAFDLSESITSFRYTGTMDEWKDVLKGLSWKYGIGSYIVYCTDGTIT